MYIYSESDQKKIADMHDAYNYLFDQILKGNIEMVKRSNREISEEKALSMALIETRSSREIKGMKEMILKIHETILPISIHRVNKGKE